MTGATNIAFAVFAGISLMVQIAPSFIRGVRRLELGTVKVDQLNVVVKSPSSGGSSWIGLSAMLDKPLSCVILYPFFGDLLPN